jgi:hypothetical protein
MAGAMNNLNLSALLLRAASPRAPWRACCVAIALCAAGVASGRGCCRRAAQAG